MTEEELYFFIRTETIRSYYKTILGREPDKDGLYNYVYSSTPLESIYSILYFSEEAELYRKEKDTLVDISNKLPISLAMFVKDVEACVEMSINSVKSIVREIVVIDTGSSDNTVNICKNLGARVYQIDFDAFNGFGNLRTVAAHLAREKFVLGLDADEVILEKDLPKFKYLIDRMEKEDIDIVGLPRKRWADLEMKEQQEKEVFPDWQFRFFRNKLEIYYTRRVHEIIKGSNKIIEVLDGPIIQHFQDVFKYGNRLKNRNTLYKKLYALDINDGVKHDETAVQELDEV